MRVRLTLLRDRHARLGWVQQVLRDWPYSLSDALASEFGRRSPVRLPQAPGSDSSESRAASLCSAIPDTSAISNVSAVARKCVGDAIARGYNTISSQSEIEEYQVR